MFDDGDLTIRELEKLTGFPSRSIHHYISRGLIPNPEGKGPAARYGREHLLRLRLIKEADAAGFKIDQRLQEALDGLSLEEMEQLVAMAQGAAPEDIRTFGEWLMTGDWRSDRRKPSARALESRMPSTAAMLRTEALYEASPMAAARDEGRADGDGSRGRRFEKPRPRARRTSGEPESWERVRFGDEVEIAWRQPTRDPRLRRRLAELLRQAQRLFESDED
jgi:DNA-binding transcriptional MerR regulator